MPIFPEGTRTMMQWIEVNGASLRYDLAGEARSLLVLVHEMGGTLESWDLVLPMLAPGRRVLRYDMRGHGASSKTRGAADLTVMADDLAALLDAVGIREPVAVCGCAVGGAVALRFAARHTDRTRTLIAMGPATGVAPDRRSATLERARLAEEQGMGPGTDALLDAAWPPVLRGDAARFASYRAKWLANDPFSFAATNRMLADLDMTADLAAIASPTLVLAGRYDGLRPPAMIEPIAARITGARFEAIDSGHFMAVQTPDLVAGKIGAFLKSVGA